MSPFAVKATYVFGAGASSHAGFPLCSELWNQIMGWVNGSADNAQYQRALDEILALNGRVLDLEQVLTDLDLGRGPFHALTEENRRSLKGKFQRCLSDYFHSICGQHLEAPLYDAFARRIEAGSQVITFNYDVCAENSLIRAGKFCVKDGYGKTFRADWDEPDSQITVLKLHGSINWIGLVFGGGQGYGGFTNSLGHRPFVDNVRGLLPAYPKRVLDKSFRGGGVTDSAATLVLPTYEKKFSVETSVGDEWGPFFESLWDQAHEAVEQTDRVVVIGYSMPKADERSRELLLSRSNRNAEIYLCSAGSNEALRGDFEAAGFSRVVEVGTFSDLVA